jgi:multidrug efflux pump subunit AcrB
MLDIELHRVSLDALVVALGMMVDNAIVVADGYVVRLKRGMRPLDAAIESATQPSLVLLGATVVAVMPFYPVFASVTDGGEYGCTLFVVTVALLLSWVISVTVTPMNCMAFLKGEGEGRAQDGDVGGQADPYDSRFFRGLLGAMSLVGMLIKNAIVLIDEINLNRSKGASPYDSVIGAGVSRVRRVALVALTTVLGVAPLLQDVFGVSYRCWRQRRVSHGAVSSMPESPSR